MFVHIVSESYSRAQVPEPAVLEASHPQPSLPFWGAAAPTFSPPVLQAKGQLADHRPLVAFPLHRKWLESKNLAHEIPEYLQKYIVLP